MLKKFIIYETNKSVATYNDETWCRIVNAELLWYIAIAIYPNYWANSFTGIEISSFLRPDAFWYEGFKGETNILLSSVYDIHVTNWGFSC